MCKSKEKAQAVDSSLMAIVGNNRKITLTGAFFKKWHEEAKAAGGSLSAQRIKTAFEKLNMEVVGVHACAKQYMEHRGWGTLTFA